MKGIINTNHKREEDVVMQRYPLSNATFTNLQNKAEMSHSLDSKQHCLFDVTCIG
jgi:hypothetical protein